MQKQDSSMWSLHWLHCPFHSHPQINCNIHFTQLLWITTNSTFVKFIYFFHNFLRNPQLFSAEPWLGSTDVVFKRKADVETVLGPSKKNAPATKALYCVAKITAINTNHSLLTSACHKWEINCIIGWTFLLPLDRSPVSGIINHCALQTTALQHISLI